MQIKNDHLIVELESGVTRSHSLLDLTDAALVEDDEVSTEAHTDTQTHRHTDTQTHRHTDTHIDTQTTHNTQHTTQTNTHTHILTHATERGRGRACAAV